MPRRPVWVSVRLLPISSAKNPARQDVTNPAAQRHTALERPAAEDQGPRSPFKTLGDAANVVCQVLAVGVRGNDADAVGRSGEQHVIERRLQRLAFTEVHGMRQHHHIGTRRDSRKCRRATGRRPVIDDDDRPAITAEIADQVGKQRSRLVRRDDNDGASACRHLPLCFCCRAKLTLLRAICSDGLILRASSPAAIP